MDRGVFPGIDSGLLLIQAPRGVCAEDSANLVPDAAEHAQLLFLGAGRVSGIVEWKMMTIHLPREHGTHLISVSANRDYRLDVVLEKFIKVLRPVGIDVDSDFSERPDCQRMNVSCGLGPCTFDSKSSAQLSLQDAFGKVGAAGVAGAKNKDRRTHE